MGHVPKQQQMTFGALITEKHCLGILFFPFSQLFSSTVRAAVEKNKEVVLCFIMQQVWFIDKLLHTLTQTGSSEDPVLCCFKTAFGTSSFFVRGGLDLPHCFLSSVVTL